MVLPSSMLHIGMRLWHTRYGVELALVALALLTRLPLLSISLDEVDTANFVNALTHGYNIPLLRPHPPGYPVYVFMGSLLNRVVPDPLLSLCLLSAVLGSLAVVPVYRLLEEFVGRPLAVAGAFFFVVHPLMWAFSEAALGDMPAVFFVSVLAWLCYRARESLGVFFPACVVASLAIGVRQSNVVLLPLLAFPLARTSLPADVRWKVAFSGAVLFAVTTAAWALPMVFIGSAGFADYSEAVAKQWSAAVSVYQWDRIEPPWLLNVVLRSERFFYAYFLTSSWTGDDAKTPLTLLLVSPWLFGFALFIISFRFASAKHVFVALWIAGIGYLALSIHFLARYALPQTPAFLIASVMGYAFLWSALVKHRWRIELLSAIGIACTLILYGIKYQPPVGAFEYTPPDGSRVGGSLVTAGIALLLGLRWFYWRYGAGPVLTSDASFSPVESGHWQRSVVATCATAMIVFGVHGFVVASAGHRQKSPSHQLVEFVKMQYESKRITPCWDNVTHSSFEALIPGVVPTGFWSVRDLYAAHDAGHTLIVTDKCVWLLELDTTLGLSEIGRFEGASPLWSKAPSLRLYVTTGSP